MNPIEFLRLLSAAAFYDQQVTAEHDLRRLRGTFDGRGWPDEGPTQRELREASNRRAAAEEGVRRAALAYAAAHLERRFEAERIPPFHVGDEPSAFDAIAHLKQSEGT